MTIKRRVGHSIGVLSSHLEAGRHRRSHADRHFQRSLLSPPGVAGSSPLSTLHIIHTSIINQQRVASASNHAFNCDGDFLICFLIYSPCPFTAHSCMYLGILLLVRALGILPAG